MEPASTVTSTPTIAPPPRHLGEAEAASRACGRVRFDDLMAFKRKDDEAREKVLDQLTAEAQDWGMGY